MTTTKTTKANKESNIEELYIDTIYTEVKKQKIENTEWKNTLVIGDVHFGVKTNAIAWYERQEEFFRKQIFPIVKSASKLNIDNVVFLGDLFDIRYSTNTMIAIRVKTLFRELNDIAESVNVNVNIIAGNHDYYSPLEEHSKYNVYDVVFGEEFTAMNKRINIATDEMQFIHKSNNNGLVALLPWYQTENKENFRKNIESIYNSNKTFSNRVYGAYAHCDLHGLKYDASDILHQLYDLNIPIWSGHIHFCDIDKEHKLYNVGACMKFNFGDADSPRYIYIVNEKDNKMVYIQNQTTPDFIIISDEDLFSTDFGTLRADFVQLQLYPKNKNSVKYVDYIKELKLNYPNITFTIKTMITDVEIDTETTSNVIYSDVKNYIEENIPTELVNTFVQIKEAYGEGN